MTTVVEVVEKVTSVASKDKQASIDVKTKTNAVEVSTRIVPVSASNIVVTPYNTITSNNLQTALQQLADRAYLSDSAPTGQGVTEGAVWYNKATEQYNVYREVNPGSFEWVPIILGAPEGTSDLLDGGAF